MKIKPIGKRVLVEKIQLEEKTNSGILLISSETDKSYFIGKIISLSDDQEIKNQFNLEDSIIFKNNSGFNIENNGTEYTMLDLDEVLGVIEK